MARILKILILIFFSGIIIITAVNSEVNNKDFHEWLSNYKKEALKNGVSQKTIDSTFKNVKFDFRLS